MLRVTRKSTEIHFGLGTIQVQPISDEVVGIVRLKELAEMHQVGTTVHDKPEIVGAPVDLIFTNVKSIEVLIKALQMIQKKMVGAT